MSVIEVRRLTKRFGLVLAVDHRSFAVEADTVVGFLGRTAAALVVSVAVAVSLAAVRATVQRDIT